MGYEELNNNNMYLKEISNGVTDGQTVIGCCDAIEYLLKTVLFNLNTDTRAGKIKKSYNIITNHNIYTRRKTNIPERKTKPGKVFEGTKSCCLTDWRCPLFSESQSEHRMSITNDLNTEPIYENKTKYQYQILMYKQRQ